MHVHVSKKLDIVYKSAILKESMREDLNKGNSKYSLRCCSAIFECVYANFCALELCLNAIDKAYYLFITPWLTLKKNLFTQLLFR